MDSLIPFFFLLYILGVVASAVIKKARGAMDVPDVRPRPVPIEEGPLADQSPFDPADRPSLDPPPAGQPSLDPSTRGQEFFDQESADRSLSDMVDEPTLSTVPTRISMADEETMTDEALSSFTDEAMLEEWSDDLQEHMPRLEPALRRSTRTLSSANLREAIIFTELLSPPRALRPYRVPSLRD